MILRLFTAFTVLLFSSGVACADILYSSGGDVVDLGANPEWIASDSGMLTDGDVWVRLFDGLTAQEVRLELWSSMGSELDCQTQFGLAGASSSGPFGGEVADAQFSGSQCAISAGTEYDLRTSAISLTGLGTFVPAGYGGNSLYGTLSDNSEVPEPSSVVAMILGLVGLGCAYRCRFPAARRAEELHPARTQSVTGSPDRTSSGLSLTHDVTPRFGTASVNVSACR